MEKFESVKTVYGSVKVKIDYHQASGEFDILEINNIDQECFTDEFIETVKESMKKVF